MLIEITIIKKELNQCIHILRNMLTQQLAVVLTLCCVGETTVVHNSRLSLHQQEQKTVLRGQVAYTQLFRQCFVCLYFMAFYLCQESLDSHFHQPGAIERGHIAEDMC
jgi:hypothetical protein